MGTREIAPFGVRMPPDLKTRLEAAAKINVRSLNAELVARLEQSLAAPRPTAPGVKENSREYQAFSESERKMLALFRAWPPEKQLSFLVLFK